MKRSLARLMEPRHVAIVGASQSPSKYGYLVLRYLLETGYAGEVFLINPRGGEALGYPFLPCLDAIGKPVDLVVSVLPPHKTAAVVADCARAGAAGVVLLAAGFAEAAGEQGAASQEAIRRTALEGGVRVVGPNCLGLFNARNGLNVMTNASIPRGSIALISQSGGLAELFFHQARRLGGGFSLCVSLGNQVDVSLAEAIEYAAAEPGSAAIAVYVEGVPDGRALIGAVSAASAVKPVAVLKGGRGVAGARATISHTASLAGSAELYDALLRRAGAVVVESLSDFYPVALTLALAPPLEGPKVAVLGGGGGTATVLADALERLGLEPPALPPELQQRLRSMLSPRANVSNPVEFAGATEDSFSIYERCAEVLLADEAVDGLALFGSFGGFRRELETEESSYLVSARAFGALSRRYAKPLLVQTYFAGDAIPALEALREEKLPCFASPETLARCLAALAEARGLPGVRQPRAASAERELGPGATLLAFERASAWLAGKGLEVVPATPVRDTPQALAAARGYGFPVVIKVLEPRLAHKSDAGAVLANVCSEAELEAAVASLLALPALGDERADAILGVSPMVRSGVEAVVGAVRDPTFGPIVMVGSGGLYLEVYRDTAFALAGLTLAEAERLIAGTKLHRVLSGARGGPPLDVAGLARVVVAASELMQETPACVEIDLNPVFVQRAGVRLADVRIVVEEPG